VNAQDAALSSHEDAGGWFYLPLGDALTATARMAELEAQFATAFDAAGRPPAMALFKRHDTDHSLHCEVTVYFSPAAAAVARHCGALPCPRPAPAHLELIGGG
jgi:hypothetical protein